MKKVVLVFPSSINMAEFILSQQIKKAEVNSIEKTLTTTITDAKIEIAQKQHGAIIKSKTPKYRTK